MNITKRDIADIVLLWMALSFLLALLTSLVTLGAYIGMTDEVNKYTDRATAVIFQLLHVAALLLLNYVILFKRSFILSLVVPVGSDNHVDIPPGLTVLASYAFWIRLLGIFTFLSSGIGFVSRLAADFAVKREFIARSFWMYNTGAQLVSTVLAGVVIWKADWIAQKIERIGAANKASQASSEPARGADSEDA
ncbi:MAG: hypothetical protein ABR497_01535 [Kiritimatiellia bacterium]|nr:hypothetical protein [Lentisphaerota bacterium]